ncbi:Hypoxanthine-guanine phosphoribosyltransferase [Candidatus Magnetomoraceae bacterium gMMP-15]
MSELIPVLSEEEIDERVSAVAKQISYDYKDKDLILIGIMKGAFIFLADLVRKLSIPAQIDFIQTKSYGLSSSSSGTIAIVKDIEINVKNKDVLLVEDIVDTGLTLTHLIDYIKAFKPKSVKLCTAIDKKERREVDIKIDYVCHRVQEGFLVGYGLDYAENHRILPGIYHIKL